MAITTVQPAQYTVGAVYISTVATSPAQIYGGVWEQIKDRFILAAGDTYSAGDTGGEATHTLTVNEMPNHSHQYNYTAYATATSGTNRRFAQGSGGQNTTLETGGGQPHNNMPPYLAVYIWKRVA